MEKRLKSKKGITLVALVITVILMLILAGVAISAIVDEEGLFGRTRNAAIAYENAAEHENKAITNLMNTVDKYINTFIDKTPPMISQTEEGAVSSSKFTLTAKGKDETKISKYEFYINGQLEKIINTSETTVTWEVDKKTPETSYICKVRVYDSGDNYKESEEIIVTTLAGVSVATTVSVGDFINYDAGIWTEEDLTTIVNSESNPTVHSSVRTDTATLPTQQGEFGGFILGQSKNINSTPNDNEFISPYEGWRVWSKEDGVVTLISAGHPETYYHNGNVANGTKSLTILKKRDCSMYENKYAVKDSAHILTGQEAVEWYNSHFNTDYTMIDNGEAKSTFRAQTFSTAYPIEVLDNGSVYWLASSYNSTNIFFVKHENHSVRQSTNNVFGVRILLSLNTDVLLENGLGDGTQASPWQIVEN